jgi:hypothetical protein
MVSFCRLIEDNSFNVLCAKFLICAKGIDFK